MSNPIGYIDRTVNTITGCAKGFDCWARGMATRLAVNPTVKNRARYDGFAPAYWPERLCQLQGHREWIAVNFMGDMFAPGVEWGWVRATLEAMALCPEQTFLILTKRPRRLADAANHSLTTTDLIRRLTNVYWGTSVSTQADAETRIPDLLQVPGKHWVSAEPALVPISLKQWLPRLNWVVMGPENGKKPRPFQMTWAVGLREECDQAKVPFWLKGAHGREWQCKPMNRSNAQREAGAVAASLHADVRGEVNRMRDKGYEALFKHLTQRNRRVQRQRSASACPGETMSTTKNAKRAIRSEALLAPFLSVARGIPDNWPGECILRFDQREDGSLYLGYYGVNAAACGITIDQWRALRGGEAVPSNGVVGRRMEVDHV